MYGESIIYICLRTYVWGIYNIHVHIRIRNMFICRNYEVSGKQHVSVPRSSAFIHKYIYEMYSYMNKHIWIRIYAEKI